MSETSFAPATPLAHLLARLRVSKVEWEPYPHYYLEDIFPDDYYRALLAKLPDSSAYQNLFEITDLKLDHFRHRDQRDLNDGWTETLSDELKEFWNSFNAWFLGTELSRAVLDSFAEPLKLRFGARESWPEVSVESQLIRHRAGYFLGPHSDLYTKLVVLLIYLAPNTSLAHSGTSLYRPRTPGFTCANSNHYPFEEFIKVKTAPYKPNSMLAFVRSDISFHGVEPLSEVDLTSSARDLIQYVLHDKRSRVAQLEARRLAAEQKVTT